MADYRSINQPNMMVYDNLATNLGDIHQQRLDINYSEMMVRDMHTCIYIIYTSTHTHTGLPRLLQCRLSKLQSGFLSKSKKQEQPWDSSMEIAFYLAKSFAVRGWETLQMHANAQN